MTLLAILGRGIQHPSAHSQEWVLTPDLEVCDEKGAHLAIRAPEDDASPYSIIGGGELNILAGALLAKRLQPQIATCAYGARSKYLNTIGAPSESQVMTDQFLAEAKREDIPAPAVNVFDEKSGKRTSRERTANCTIFSRLPRTSISRRSPSSPSPSTCPARS